MKKASKFLGFIAMAIAMFMGTLDGTIINIALPTITAHYKSSLNNTSWISTIYVLSISVFMITASKIADQFGRKKVMIAGLLLFGGSSAMCGFSGSLMVLIIMRFTQGIGCAIITPLVVPMALDSFGKEKTTIIASAIGAITALAAAGGPPIGGLLLEYASWQSIFFINIPFAFISLVFTVFFIRESYDETVSKSIDWAGMILLSATLFFLTFGLLKGNDYGWGSYTILSMFIGSAVSLVLFILAERKVKAPMMEFSQFKEMTFTASTVCYLITGFAMVVPGLIFNYFLQNAMGFQPLHAALVVTPMALTVIISMPVGTVISKRMDARLVNFLGIFGMGIGAFTLSRLTVHTSELVMIAEMVIFGFALGFSVQALISSIKYIPVEKSGIGSGIVNSARYIGTCISIALLVSILTIHVTGARNDISSNAIKDINSHTNIAASLRKVMVDDINNGIKNGNSDNMQQTDFKDKMEKDIKDSLEKLAAATPPESNEVLKKLYDGASALKDGVNKAADGQEKLGKGINDLNTGLNDLHTGSISLASGLESLENGLIKAFGGTQQLKSASSQGSTALTAGIAQLNSGAQAMLSQFSGSSDTNNPTVFDAVSGISAGTQTLSTNTDNYVAAVNNTIYVMIRNNPSSPALLTGYKDSFAKASAAYNQADSKVKPQYLQQIQMLANLINLYTAGTDSSVTDETQFEAKLIVLAKQNDSNGTVISGGAKVEAGTAQLAAASQKLAAQFGDGGSFKSGMTGLADGAGKLAEAGGNLAALQEGVGKLSDSLSQLKEGSSKLNTGARDLQKGVETAQTGGSSLKTGSDELVAASGQLKDGTADLVNGIALAGQKVEIEDIMDRLNSNKDEEVADAFDKTFLVAAVLLILLSVFGLFTDKNTKASNNADQEERKPVQVPIL
jgi:EmrB/QacA subfamily drug resistance transporter